VTDRTADPAATSRTADHLAASRTADQRAASRTAVVDRTTRESTVHLELDLDGTGVVDAVTGVGFYDHLLTALGTHALFDLTVRAEGDLHIDVHHTVEDVAIALGDALDEALGDRAGITRFGDAVVPLDEALAQAVVDLSGRPYCVCTGEPPGQDLHLIGGHFTGSLTRHVVESIAVHSRSAVHLRLLAGRDPHHIAEAQVKALARALRLAVEPDPRRAGVVPSSKGVL